MAARLTNKQTPSLAPIEPAIKVTAEEVHQTLESIFKSKHFAHSPKKQKFLQLICDYYLRGQVAELNEYLIGSEVFERGADYNPSADPIVRVGAHDIRKKLDLYYQNEGVADPIRLVVPLGKYEPLFICHSQPEPVAAHVRDFNEENQSAPKKLFDQHEETAPLVAFTEPTSLITKKSKLNWKWIAGGVLALLFAALSGWVIGARGWSMQSQVIAWPQTISAVIGSPVWQPFLKEPPPTMLVLSNPTVYRAANEADPPVATQGGATLSVEQARILTSAVADRMPFLPNQSVRLIPAFSMYTGIGEAIGAYQIALLLQAAGKQTLLKQSRSVGPEDFKQYNAILLGSVYSNQWSKPLSIKENFVYTSNASIQNMEPLPGEAREYKAIFDQRNGVLIEDYALISVIPGVSQEHTVMVLAGIFSEGTQAAAEYVVSANTLQELNQRLSQHSVLPRYYQILLKVRVENAFPTKATLVAFRELKAQTPEP